MDQTALEACKKAAKSVADELGYELYDVRNYNEDGTEFLEVSVDKDYAITLDQVETYSNALSQALDKLDALIVSPYTLDVASPGAERDFPKEDLPKVIGRYVQVTQDAPKDTIVEGTIESFDGSILLLKRFFKGRKKLYRIPYEKIVKCRFLVKI